MWQSQQIKDRLYSHSRTHPQQHWHHRNRWVHHHTGMLNRNSNSRTSLSSYELRISNLKIEYRCDTFGFSATRGRPRNMSLVDGRTVERILISTAWTRAMERELWRTDAKNSIGQCSTSIMCQWETPHNLFLKSYKIQIKIPQITIFALVLRLCAA